MANRTWYFFEYNREQNDVIPASPGVITYHSQKAKVPNQVLQLSENGMLLPQNETLSSIGFEHKVHKRRDKNCFLLEFDLRSPGREPAVKTFRLHSNITVLLKFYRSIHKVLGQRRYFTPMKLCECFLSLHPLPKVASTLDRTKINHPWLNHLQTLHTH